jgi:hypothetical protein
MGNSTLEKMQAAGLDVDDEELTPSDEFTDETELVLEGDDDTVVVADSDEGTLAEQGEEQHRHNKVSVTKQQLSKLRRTRREAREQAAEKDSELQSVRQELAELRRTVTPKPQYTDFANDEDYEKALLAYHQSVGDRPAAPQAEVRGPAAADHSDAINAHLDRVESLGVPAQKYMEADATVRQVFGDSITDALIAAVDDGSEKAILAMGSRPAELAAVQRLLTDDPSGLRAVSYLGKLAARTSFKSKKTISDAPSPTRSPAGGNSGALSDSAFEKKMSAAEKAGDVQAMVNLRRAQRKAKAAANG